MKYKDLWDELKADLEEILDIGYSSDIRIELVIRQMKRMEKSFEKEMK